MRVTLACASCRRSKVKCVHDGTAPCRACRRTSKESACALSVPEPQTQSSKMVIKKRGRTEKISRNGSADPSLARGDKSRTHDKLSEPSVLAQSSVNPVEDTPLPILLEAARLFVSSIPGVSLIHAPTLIQALRSGNYNKIQVCALVAVCAHLIPELRDQHGSAAQAGQHYAEFVRGQLDAMMRQGPQVETIQCILLMGMYEWGAAHGFSAWMYTGMAIRMAQALRPDLNCQHSLIDPDAAILQEIRNRTIWSCFTLDRLLSCGKGRPLVFVSANMQVPLPLSEPDYAFGDVKKERRYLRTMIAEPQLFESQLSIQDHFTVIVRGIDIWATLSKRSADGSPKRQYTPDDCPWISTSTWSKINRDLEIWRSCQDERIKYSPVRVTAQIHQGHPEAFAFINFLYYLSLIFLHREFVPLLPLRAGAPIGPIEPSFLREQAPPGWWESSVEVLHHAAQSVADIFDELDKAGITMMTPLAGFSAFSAAITLSHVAAFPHINLGRSPDAHSSAEFLLGYLKKFGSLLKIGEDWVSTLAEARQLFERASSSKIRYTEKGMSLGDQIFEYGSIYTTPSSNKDSNSHITTQNDSPPKEALEAQSAPAIVPYGAEASGYHSSAMDESLDFDEQIWRLNDVLLGEQYLTSFIMGNEIDQW